ncbi:MAG TPA: DUF2461 domain-containing protein [Rhizomicrobium sp.]|nr:DUF2461 domain-containing protein [Rhizomicrobium sp.]
MGERFEGFPKDFFAFFRELKSHNDRAWFEANKQRFRKSVQVPMSAFIAAMSPHLRRVSKHFTADPRPNGGSMFRIYRDVRFARDKRPYKEHAACHFRHALGKDVHAPGFYMHFAPGEVFFGAGLWHPEADALAKVRAAVAESSSAWRKAVDGKDFTRRFGKVQGEALTRPPRGFDPEHPLIGDIKRKSFYAMQQADPKLAQSPELVDEVAGSFRAIAPLMRFLCGALDAPF